MKKLAYLWNTPSSFRDDWRKYWWNVIGHTFVVGFLPAFIFGTFGLVLCLVAYSVWELTQWQYRRAFVSDCWEDFAFVAAGAFFGVTLSVGYAIVALAFLVAGVSWRVEDRADVVS